MPRQFYLNEIKKQAQFIQGQTQAYSTPLEANIFTLAQTAEAMADEIERLREELDDARAGAVIFGEGYP